MKIIVPYETNKYSIHAEVSCMIKCDKKILSQCELLVIKIKNGRVTTATPCQKCLNYIKKCGVRKISSYIPFSN